ncbi:hypothetical protein EJB05_11152 [Eragrostis curvula]|uniref:Secreted protein n=1 Tax=Eragrostis curvula TaxID=38414 RepID=A0A5J9VQN3_9POAL|nr:hypothetical protein EJB05_11152 [Eragrostis curvula]
MQQQVSRHCSSCASASLVLTLLPLSGSQLPRRRSERGCELKSNETFQTARYGMMVLVGPYGYTWHIAVSGRSSDMKKMNASY